MAAIGIREREGAGLGDEHDPAWRPGPLGPAPPPGGVMGPREWPPGRPAIPGRMTAPTARPSRPRRPPRARRRARAAAATGVGAAARVEGRNRRAATPRVVRATHGAHDMGRRSRRGQAWSAAGLGEVQRFTGQRQPGQLRLRVQAEPFLHRRALVRVEVHPVAAGDQRAARGAGSFTTSQPRTNMAKILFSQRSALRPKPLPLLGGVTPGQPSSSPTRFSKRSSGAPGLSCHAARLSRSTDTNEPGTRPRNDPRRPAPDRSPSREFQSGEQNVTSG